MKLQKQIITLLIVGTSFMCNLNAQDTLQCSFSDYYQYSYNSDGRLIKKIHTDLSKKSKDSVIYLYNIDQLIKTIEYSLPKTDTTLFFYKNNKLSKKTFSDKATEYVYTYNKAGNLLYVIEYKPSGMLLDTLEKYVYDDRGNIIIEETKTRAGRYTVIDNNRYTYDKLNRKVSAAHYSDKGSVINSSTYVYDDQKIVKEYEFDAGNHLTDSVIYQYDGNDSLVLEAKYENGRICRKRVWDYSIPHKVTYKRYFYFKDGEVDSFYWSIEYYSNKNQLVEMYSGESDQWLYIKED